MKSRQPNASGVGPRRSRRSLERLSTRSVLSFAAVVVAFGQLPAAAPGQCVRSEDVGNARPLKLFYSLERGDNFTAASEDGERSALASGYQFVRVEGYVLSAAAPGSVPLKLFYSDARRDNFTTATSEGERAALASGYRFVRVEGYVYPSPQPGTVPLKLFWGARRNDNFSSATPEGERDALASRYAEVRIEGYVLKPSSSVQAGCGLGVRWDETESGWTGTWTRRGESDTFDAHWTHPGAQPTTALLRVGIAGSTVNVERTQAGGTCTYGGTLGGDGVTVTGTYTCSWAPGRYDFRAAIRCGGDPRPAAGGNACDLECDRQCKAQGRAGGRFSGGVCLLGLPSGGTCACN